MAGRVMPARIIAAIAALVLPAASAAQGLPDPTRPPLELLEAAGGAAQGAAARAAARPRLESILLSSARKGAIINGKYVPLGGSYGKANLIEITATGVTLKSDQGLEVLQLYPPMAKTPEAPGAEEQSEKTVKHP